MLSLSGKEMASCQWGSVSPCLSSRSAETEQMYTLISTYSACRVSMTAQEDGAPGPLFLAVSLVMVTCWSHGAAMAEHCQDVKRVTDAEAVRAMCYAVLSLEKRESSAGRRHEGRPSPRAPAAPV